MRTRNYQSLYRRTFATLGTKLTARDRTPPEKIAAAEKKLGLRLPRALRDYYLVAGRERFLNHAHNHLCAPRDWERRMLGRSSSWQRISALSSGPSRRVPN